MTSQLRNTLLALLIVTILSGCSRNASYIILVTATPSGYIYQPDSPTAEVSEGEPASAPEVAVEINLPTPTYIPTPDPTRTAVIDPTENQVHIVQTGDTLAQIGIRYGVSIEAIVVTNGLSNENILSVGQSLIIPTAIETIGPDFKILPDSELVYGPALKDFSTEEFVALRPNSFLASYQEEFNGMMLSGAEIIERVALEQSINPRLLLALLEYESQWLSQPTLSDEAISYPMGYLELPGQVYGLYKQLDWAGKVLAVGYYGWRERGLSATLLADGMRVGLDPTINAGTAGVQVLLAQTRTNYDWQVASDHNGFFVTYNNLFGDPFQYAVEPLIPNDLTQPEMSMPWDTENETWYFTGGPHGGWGSSSGWAALDFVPTDTVDLGCTISPMWARAVADGVIARSEYGIVILDLDGDGFEGTGWTVFYLHLTSVDRPVKEGDVVKQGDPVGHPECEGGVSYATHLHIARRYNGEWIPADCTSCPLTITAPPLVFDGWQAYTFNNEYDGSMMLNQEYREACTCREAFNTFGPEAFK
ncbi:MAG: LysM peptidoglycan-binding domain-containing protein [Anaerolineae bacterium]|nr:LysM peptidoglycan-binding domain-containing protein [Anaerolineae bacterium]